MVRKIGRSWLAVAAVAAITALSRPAAAAPPVTARCPPSAVCEERTIEPPEALQEPPAEAETEAGAQLPLESEAGDWHPPDADAPRPRPEGIDLGQAGLALFIVGYAPAFVAGCVMMGLADKQEDGSVSDEELSKRALLLLPVVGPPLTGETLEVGPGGWIVLAASAGAQLIGLILVGVDLAMDIATASVARVRPVLVGNATSSLGLGVAGSF